MQVQTSEWDCETTMVDSNSMVILSTVLAKACLVFTAVTSLQELPQGSADRGDKADFRLITTPPPVSA
jgi:hypothetical protein